MDKKEQINRYYEENAVGIYPFINKNRITILEKGYYIKKKASYRGISYIYDEFDSQYKTLLLGYYYIPDNYLIVPEHLELTEGKQNLIDTYINKGFIKVSVFPSFKPVSFSEDSEEYKVAYQSYIEHKK